MEYQARAGADEATGVPVDDLYNYLAEHFDLARFEIGAILAHFGDRVTRPSEDAIFVNSNEV